MIAVIAVWSAVNAKLITRAMTDEHPDLSQCETLITGDSHTQTAIDPQLMKNASSLSYSNENIFFTYYKIKWALENGKRIERVILGLSCHSLTDIQEDVIKNRTFFLEHNFLLLDSEGKNAVAGKSKDLLNYFTMKYRFGFPLNFYNNDLLLISFSADKEEFRKKIWGGYKKMETANLSEAEKQKMLSERGTRDYGESALMEEYLEKTIQLCFEKEVKLYLVNTPMNELFYERYSEKTKSSFLREAGLLTDDGRVFYLDMQRAVTEDSLFYDGEHLNETGARIFTPMIDSIIRDREKDAV